MHMRIVSIDRTNLIVSYLRVRMVVANVVPANALTNGSGAIIDQTVRTGRTKISVVSFWRFFAFVSRPLISNDFQNTRPSVTE